MNVVLQFRASVGWRLNDIPRAEGGGYLCAYARIVSGLAESGLSPATPMTKRWGVFSDRSEDLMRLRQCLHPPGLHLPSRRGGANVAIAMLSGGCAVAFIVVRASDAPRYVGTRLLSMQHAAESAGPTDSTASTPKLATGFAADASASQWSHVPGIDKRRVVATANRSPMWELTSSNIVQSVAPGGALLPLRATDADGDALVYTVSGGAFPGTMLLLANGSFAGTAFTVGNYHTQVTATDAHGAAASTVVEVSIMNRSPQFASAPSNTKQKVLTGSPLVRMVAGDADAEPVVFDLTAGTLPPGVMLRADGSFDGVPQSPGNYVADIVALDPHGAAAAVTLAVTVEPSTSYSTSVASTTVPSRTQLVRPSTVPVVQGIARIAPITEVEERPIAGSTVIAPLPTAATDAAPTLDDAAGVRSRLDSEPNSEPTPSTLAVNGQTPMPPIG